MPTPRICNNNNNNIPLSVIDDGMCPPRWLCPPCAPHRWPLLSPTPPRTPRSISARTTTMNFPPRPNNTANCLVTTRWASPFRRHRHFTAKTPSHRPARRLRPLRHHPPLPSVVPPPPTTWARRCCPAALPPPTPKPSSPTRSRLRLSWKRRCPFVTTIPRSKTKSCNHCPPPWSPDRNVPTASLPITRHSSEYPRRRSKSRRMKRSPIRSLRCRNRRMSLFPSSHRTIVGQAAAAAAAAQRRQAFSGVGS